MRTHSSIRKEKRQRINPNIFNARYFHLKQLKKYLIITIQKHVATSKNDILIDFGCGSMPYKDYFIPYVSKYVGVDIEENEIADIHLNDLKSSLYNEYADIILSTQVLEHVIDPNFYLQESNRILKQDGLMLLSTHGIWRYHPDPTDYWRWTIEGLRKILNDNGFEVIKVYGIMGLASMGLLLFQDAFLYKIPNIIKLLFVPIMQIQMILFDKIHNKSNKEKDAGVFLIVAKKIK